MKKNLLSDKEIETIRQIRNSLMHKGRTPSIRELMVNLGYRSPRSISLIIDKLIKKSILRRRSDGYLQLIRNLDDDLMRAQTVDVPLVGTVACGTPVLAEENIEAMIPVSVKLARTPHKYFLLRANGDSMNDKNINDGDLVLVRYQTTAESGDIVVALIDNEATIKEFHVSGEMIILKPRSLNIQHKPIVLTSDFQVQGIVISVIPHL